MVDEAVQVGEQQAVPRLGWAVANLVLVLMLLIVLLFRLKYQLEHRTVTP
jgi:hypothetical protein